MATSIPDEMFKKKPKPQSTETYDGIQVKRNNKLKRVEAEAETDGVYVDLNQLEELERLKAEQKEIMDMIARE